MHWLAAPCCLPAHINKLYYQVPLTNNSTDHRFWKNRLQDQLHNHLDFCISCVKLHSNISAAMASAVASSVVAPVALSATASSAPTSHKAKSVKAGFSGLKSATTLFSSTSCATRTPTGTRSSPRAATPSSPASTPSSARPSATTPPQLPSTSAPGT
jgi:hypothetical protein